MAYRPCMTCGAKFFGASLFTYFTYFDGDTRFGFRVSECPECAHARRADYSSIFDRRVGDDWEIPAEPPRQPKMVAAFAAAAENGSYSGRANKKDGAA